MIRFPPLKRWNENLHNVLMNEDVIKVSYGSLAGPTPEVGRSMIWLIIFGPELGVENLLINLHSSCSFSSITATAGIDASTSTTATLTPASTTSWSSDRVKNRYDLHHQQHLGRAPYEPFRSPSPSNFLDRRNLEDVGEKVEEKFMSNNYPSHQQAPLSAGLIRQMPGVQKIFNFFTGGETSQQQNLSTLNKEEEKILDSEIGGGQILKANSTLNISASTAGSTSCLSAASSSGGGNAGSSPGGSGGRFHSQPRQPPTPQQALRQKRNICLPCAGLLRDGPLTHKRVTTASASTNQGRPRRFNEKVWRHYWSVLHNSKIYLCKQKPSLDTNDSIDQDKFLPSSCFPWKRYRIIPHSIELSNSLHMIVMSDVCDENVIDIEGCIADIAYDYHKRKNVFRLTTQNQNEHLFQAEEPDSMLQWLKAVQCCSSSDDNLNNSMALIVKRYEAAQSHSVSPSSSSRLRRPAFMNINVGGTAAPLTSSSKKSSYGDGNENLQPRHGKVKESVSDSSGQSQTTTATAATTSTAAMKNNVHAVVAQRESSSLQSVLSAHAEKFDRKEKAYLRYFLLGEISISVKSRKWRKVRKSGSCPSGPNARSGGGTNSRDCMLGQQIEECVTSGDNDYIPLIVRLCVKVVEHYGLNTIGVYRIPGNTAAVNALISSLDKGFENTDFNDSRWRDVNVVSSLLKAFLRRLPDPLLTDRFYLEFIQANRIDDNSARLRKLKQTIHKLPRANYETTKYLMFHLRRIVQHSEINKMEAKNLALMFAPSIIRPGSDSMATMVSHMSDQCKIIESLILYCDWLFSAPETSPGDRTPPLTPILIDSMEKHDLYSPPEMSELLSRMVKTEEDLMHAKHSITKNILKIRRNSRKSSTKIGGVGKVSTSNRKNDDDDDAEEDEDDEEEENERQDSETENEQEEEQQQESFNSLENLTTTTPLTTLKKNSKNLQRRKSSKKRRQNDYNERNIDAEIENRRQENFDVTDFRSEAEELRRLREEQLYTARRIFITGPPLDAESLTPDVFSDRSPVNSGQVENLQALNINSLNSSLDVLSPETREKIRQFQAESRKFSSTLKVHNLPNNKPIGNKNCSSSTNLNIITTNMNCKQQAVFLTPESAVVPSGHSSHQNMMSHSTMLIPGSGNQPNTTSDYSSANDSPVSGYTLNNNNVSCRESERQLRATAAPSTKTPKQQQQTQDFALQYFNNLSISISTPAVVTGPTNYKMSSQNDEIRRQKNQSCESCTSFSISPSTTSHSREWSLSIGVPSSSALAEKRVIKEDEEMQQISQVFSPPKSSLSSKIGQKMKFRSRSASNLKRKETRRHTLSNARDVENMVQKALEKNRAATEDVDACVKKRSGGAKFRFWFGKE
uniref:Uncharacterized protein n=1 Tax=Romanomermis culicivorax TaxID=13658 RepID=A0A915J625_ROMCU